MAAETLPGTPQFSRPELHGPSALGLDQLVDFHLEHNPDYPFARLTPRDGRVLTVTWRELSEAVHRVGHALKASIGSFDAASPPVVGLLIPDDGLPYITTQLALVRIGLIVRFLVLEMQSDH
jgi:acyl-CoA synthetase (AMP-forming)/AMP-acid ligase II